MQLAIGCELFGEMLRSMNSPPYIITNPQRLLIIISVGSALLSELFANFINKCVSGK